MCDKFLKVENLFEIWQIEDQFLKITVKDSANSRNV